MGGFDGYVELQDEIIVVWSQWWRCGGKITEVMIVLTAMTLLVHEVVIVLVEGE